MEDTLRLPGGRSYTYDNDTIGTASPWEGVESYPFVRVSGINRASIAGSFVVSAWAKAPNTPDAILAGYEPVFSRWHVTGCANCNNHLSVTAHMPLINWLKPQSLRFEVRVDSGDGTGGYVASEEAALFTLEST